MNSDLQKIENENNLDFLEKRGLSINDVKENLWKNCGNISQTLIDLDISSSYFYRHLRHLPEIEELFCLVDDFAFDLIKNRLYQLASQGNVPAIGKYLEYAPTAKSKGWAKENNINLNQVKPLTEDEKKKLVNELF